MGKPRVRIVTNPIPNIDSEWPEQGQGKKGLKMEFFTVDGSLHVKMPERDWGRVALRDWGLPSGFYAGKIWKSSCGVLTWIYEIEPKPCGKRMCATRSATIFNSPYALL